MTKIALIGYGKMGKAIDRIAPKAGVEVVAKVSPNSAEASHRKLTAEAVADADVCIEFSHPDAVMDNVRRIVDLGKPVVIGTTGWHHQLETVQQLVTEAGTGGLYAENFSIGVQLFLQVVREAAHLFNSWPQYDIACSEEHHRAKVDSPSGTALAMAHTLIESLDRKDTVRPKDALGAPLDSEIDIASTRCGSIPGTHTALFDSPIDTIAITHTARSRDGFAMGSIQAAQWLLGKKGLYHINDMLLERNGGVSHDL